MSANFPQAGRYQSLRGTILGHIHALANPAQLDARDAEFAGQFTNLRELQVRAAERRETPAELLRFRLSAHKHLESRRPPVVHREGRLEGFLGLIGPHRVAGRASALPGVATA